MALTYRADFTSYHIYSLSIGNAVLQQRHTPYIAVSTRLIHTMQFHLPRTEATVLNQGLGYGFNIKIRVFIQGSGKVGHVNQVNHTSWMAVVTPTDRPKSVRNRCVIELFCDLVCVVTLPF